MDWPCTAFCKVVNIPSQPWRHRFAHPIDLLQADGSDDHIEPAVRCDGNSQASERHRKLEQNTVLVLHST